MKLISLILIAVTCSGCLVVQRPHCHACHPPIFIGPPLR